MERPKNPEEKPRPKNPKRAIALAGGGPAAGLHIGVLLHLDDINRKRKARGEDEIDFKVWALSCIGAWVGIVYNQFDEDKDKTKAQKTYEFFRNNIFRDDAAYANYPINRAFGPDSLGYFNAWLDFIREPTSYKKLVLPDHIMEAVVRSFRVFTEWPRMSEADWNDWWHNDMLAANPAVRFMVSLMYLSSINGLTKIYYDDSAFLRSIGFDTVSNIGPHIHHSSALRNVGPHIYHNAWDLTNRRMELFHNKPGEVNTAGKRKYREISDASLCACSALPYIEQTVSIQDVVYCEGALVDTVNFKDLLEDHPDLDEVWVSRIVDVKQVTAPNNIADGLANLCMLFAAELGDNDVKLFKQHLRKRGRWTPRVIEIPLNSVLDPLPDEDGIHKTIDFRWNHENLERGIRIGKAAFQETLRGY